MVRRLSQTPASTTAHVRLGEAIRARREQVLDRLCELEWAADRDDPRALVKGRDLVRPRAELFLDTLLEGLVGGDWSRFEGAIGSRTSQLLEEGVISGDDLNGRALRLATSLLPVVLAEPDPEPVLAALFDTMQKLSGRIVSRYNDSLLEESRRLDDLKTMILRMTGHELRAPLGTIRGYSSMLREGDFGEVPSAFASPIAAIDAAAASGLAMIDRLVEVARLESGGEALHRAPHRVDHVLELAVEPLAEAARKLGVRLNVDATAGEAMLDADEVAIAIRNLLGNALKYAARGGVVTVRAGVSQGVAWFEVEDRGPGIAEADRERVFDRYFRSERTRGEGISGSGLGLYIVRRIAELHGGSVAVSAARDGGALFRLELPAAPDRRQPIA